MKSRFPHVSIFGKLTVLGILESGTKRHYFILDCTDCEETRGVQCIQCMVTFQVKMHTNGIKANIENV